MALYTDNVSPKANQLANFPLNFLRTGVYYYFDGKMYSRTTDGYWWSATRSSATSANNLDTTTSRVYPQYSYTRGYGFALRCGAYNFYYGSLLGTIILDVFLMVVV